MKFEMFHRINIFKSCIIGWISRFSPVSRYLKTFYNNWDLPYLLDRDCLQNNAVKQDLMSANRTWENINSIEEFMKD